MTQGQGNPENSTAEPFGKSIPAPISQRVEKISERANQLGGQMSRNVDRAMNATASKLEQTSSRISKMANYFREHNSNDLMGALEGTIRKYPTRSILVGVLGGVILSGLLRRR